MSLNQAIGRDREELEGFLQHLDGLMLADRPELLRRIQGLGRRLKAGLPVERGLAAVKERLERSKARVQQRHSALPAVKFPGDLPVAAHREAIAEAIRAHPVVVVCGETGSGKTTQLPKLCLSLGRGVRGLIGHTQPRRIAARSVAARIADELGTELGRYVGYKVRFSEHTQASAYVRLMTDGILLAEIQGDPDLLAYDTLIIDEAHERSLNIDFLLGYLKTLLPRRPDLRVIITSATIDPARFSRHFEDAPVISVEGRTWPVEVRYRPLQGPDEDQRDRDRVQAVLDAVDEATTCGPGDILVFLEGERAIRETAEALRKHHPRDSEILPLYARLSAAEQQRVFRTGGRRRIVLATNVAETSLTVPGIRYVVDTGLARISRYSRRTKVQRLPIERISRASADQRKGRCGRIGTGICFRLYDEEDYLGRPEYTEPEIQRSNLAAVILRMAASGLGDVARFPFVDPPDPRLIGDGYRLLQELGAVDTGKCLTEMGRELSRLPVDPRLGRMVLAAREQGCLGQVLVIVSALVVQDPRERPLDRQARADEAHARFQDERSDFLGLLMLWDFYHEQARHLSQNKLRRLCRDHFLSYVRMREWHDVHQQLLGQVHDMGMSTGGPPADYEVLHRALLHGLLSHVAVKDEEQSYKGARGTRLHVFPGSGLFKRPPKWLMAAELVETGRLYGRTLARIEPGWVEAAAGHLVRRSYGEPRWNPRRAQVTATETVSLYGLVLASERRVDYGRVDPVSAREVFIRSALVEGEYRTRAPFFEHNLQLVRSVRGLEDRARRRDVLVDAEALYGFYDERLPLGIHGGISFERWRRRRERKDPRVLFMSREYLMRHDAGSVTRERYPEEVRVGDLSLSLNYRFEPGHEDDGVTVDMPLTVLNTVSPEPFEWLVPGFLEDKVVHLIRALPKALRRRFVPVPDFARACMEAMTPGEGSLMEQLRRELQRMSGLPLPSNSISDEGLPPFLRMRYRVLDESGKALATGRDLDELQREFRGQAWERFRPGAETGLEREGIADWDIGDLPEETSFSRTGARLTGYPALTDEDGRVCLRLFETRERARTAHQAGLRRLFLVTLGPQVKALEKQLKRLDRACLLYTGLAPPPDWCAREFSMGSDGCAELRRDVVLATAGLTFLKDAPDIRNAVDFSTRREDGRSRFMGLGMELAGQVEEILGRQRELRAGLSGGASPERRRVHQDLKHQLDSLVFRGFVAAVPPAWLREYPRYFQAMEIRLARLAGNLERDARLQGEVNALWSAWLERIRDDRERADQDPELAQFRWLLEELRVSLFAQGLKTRVPVSAKRLVRRLAEAGP